MVGMPFSSFNSWSGKEKRTFAGIMMLCVAILFVGIALQIYPRIVAQQDLLAEIGNITTADLQTARFDSGQNPAKRKLCFLEADATALRFLAEKLSLAVAKRGPDRTLVVMEFTVTFSASKSQQLRFLAVVYSKAPDDVFLRNYSYDDASVAQKKPESFEVRIPGLSSWISQKFNEHRCGLGL